LQRHRLQPPEPAIERRHAVLVVEDDPAIRRLLEALLASAGHEVITAVDGPEALALLADARPSAVFLDLTLPEMSGWDVLDRLRACADAPPVVLLTADAAAVRRARQAGAADAILKPFDIDEVLEVAGRLLAD
jgi:DNA-binding response OmpR family regulator